VEWAVHKRNAMKILWMSDSPTTPSGFGNVTRFICEGLAQRGHDVHVLGWQETGSSRKVDDLTLHGHGRHPMGADVLLTHLYRLRPDYLVTLADVWWLTFLTDPAVEQYLSMTSTRWVTYFPIDGHRLDGSLPPSWIEILRRADLRVAMSSYGRDLVRHHGMDCDYIPHGVESAMFCPPADRGAAKRRLGYDGQFVVLSDARNQPRKMLHRLLTIFEGVSRRRSDAILHLHCDPDDPSTQEPRYSYRIREDVRALGLDDRVRFTGGFSVRNGLSLESLVRLYQAADLHALVSHGEGFGLPTLQASACGVVPVAPAYSANVELLGEHGVGIRVADFVCDEFGIGRAFVDLDDAIEVITSLAADPHSLAQRRERARQFAVRYDWNAVIPQWDGLLRDRSSLGYRRASRNRDADTRSVTLSGPGVPRVFAALHGGANLLAEAASAPGDGVRITIAVREQRVGEIANRVMLDAQNDPDSPALNVPIVRTTPSASRSAVSRPRVYVAAGSGSMSMAVFEGLRAIFPALELAGRWRSSDLTELADSLSGCVLAVDVDATDNRPGQRDALAEVCAQRGVPLIGRSANDAHSRLWPDLCVADGRLSAAVGAGRRVLADVLYAAEVGSFARASAVRAHVREVPVVASVSED
jgi:glycosyltransferase involved in cell wall biosynthesis